MNFCIHPKTMLSKFDPNFILFEKSLSSNVLLSLLSNFKISTLQEGLKTQYSSFHSLKSVRKKFDFNLFLKFELQKDTPFIT